LTGPFTPISCSAPWAAAHPASLEHRLSQDKTKIGVPPDADLCFGTLLDCQQVFEILHLPFQALDPSLVNRAAPLREIAAGHWAAI